MGGVRFVGSGGRGFISSWMTGVAVPAGHAIVSSIFPSSGLEGTASRC